MIIFEALNVVIILIWCIALIIVLIAFPDMPIKHKVALIAVAPVAILVLLFIAVHSYYEKLRDKK